VLVSVRLGSCWFLGNEICRGDAMIALPVIANQEVVMLYPIHHLFRAFIAVAFSLLGSTAWSAAALQPIENFTKRPVLSDVTLSWQSSCSTKKAAACWPR
jgi:hypothetical protein